MRNFNINRIPKILVFVIFTVLLGCERKNEYGIRTETIRVDSLNQIQLLNHRLVKPVIYTNISGLERLPVQKAKATFISAILPSILIAKHHIEHDRKKLVLLQAKRGWTRADSLFISKLKATYKAKSVDELIYKVRSLPNSIVLAQAAVESGWGQSRFFVQANNLFGIWSFNKNEPRLTAARIRGNKRIYLRSYQNLTESINHYFEILSRSKAYRSLRKARIDTMDPMKLLPHLRNFSERRTSYINQLESVILLNKLKHYDHYEIDPQYLVAD
jgi:Bax protein